MSSDAAITRSRAELRIDRLENFHRENHAWIPLLALLFVTAFIAWAMVFRIDEVTRATGEVIASSRVQIIQAVDGGVLSRLDVKEGDRVTSGQVLAQLDQTRVGATLGESDARLFALKAKAVRLRAEVTDATELKFTDNSYREQVAVERALFRQRRLGLREEIRTLQVAADLAKKQLTMTERLAASGDVSDSEILRAQRELNDAESRVINRKNKFLEDARIELAKTEDDIAQNEQVLTRHKQEWRDSVFTAQVAGIVKNIRVTTLGGVLRAGEEMMQIVPLDDDLVVEAKVRPADIAHLREGLNATIRLDAFDYTIFGTVPGKVIFVSADTLKDESAKGQDIYYRVRVSMASGALHTSSGKPIELLPGMTAQVDIRTGDRTLMGYLLKPLRKTVAESFGER